MNRTPDQRKANRRVVYVMGGLMVFMGCLTYAAVPLYRMFCEATGYGGTTQRTVEVPAEMGERIITVRFNADIGGVDLPWRFAPEEKEAVVHVGEQRLTFFKAQNLANESTVGTATFNVTPFKAGPYFQKVACFCFDEQALDAGESVDMGVSFFVDPAIDNDPNLRDVKTITLSYTFFRAKDEKARLTRLVPSASGTGVN